MTCCGLWIARSTICTALVDADGKQLSAFPIARTNEARGNYLAHMAAERGADCRLVLTDVQARLDVIAHLAVEMKLTVHLAPWRTVGWIRDVAGLARGPPRRTALLLARMGLHPLFRPQLHRLESDDRQLSML